MAKGNAAPSSASASAAAQPKAHKKNNEAKPASKKLNKTDQKWMENYERLKQYKAEHGHTYVSPEDADIYYPFENEGTRKGAVVKDRDFYTFAKWVERQRRTKKNGKLRKDREKLLEEIDFYFNSGDYAWDMTLDEIKAIKEKVGHIDIPSTRPQLTDANKIYEPFMTWAEEQRVQYAMHQEGWHSTITERRINKLNDIGFAWSNGDEDTKRIVDKAFKKDYSWRIRNLRPIWHMIWDEILAAKKEHEDTGESTIPTYNGQLIARESDGSYFLIFPSELERFAIENENGEKTYPILSFGQ